MKRKEYLQWCKDRAMEYANVNDLSQAVASMASDMKKSPDTDSPLLSFLVFDGMTSAQKGDKQAVIRWIQGFN